MSRSDLFFIVMSAVIVGGSLLAISIAAIVRYSRHEEAGNRSYPKAMPDLTLVLLAFAVAGYGMWRAGIFGAVN
ncbi:MAG TPA: hypothetical protein VF450_01065 [Noviherbaspirillum sp.]|jgi:hypothetical protein